jgi:hypothetical protein
LQGYDSLTPFAYSQGQEPSGKLSDFEMESDPATVASIAAGALIYRRGDVSPGKELAVMFLPADEQYAMHWEDGYAKAFEHTAEFRAMVETHRVAVVYGDRMPEGAAAPAVTMTPGSAYAYRHEGTQLLSDTKEVWRDWGLGVGLINTPRTQAAYGFLSKTPISTTDVSFDISTPFAAVSLSSLTMVPIKESGHLLLTAVARAEDANQTYNLSRTHLNTRGQMPVVAEPVVGVVTFATGEKALVARALMPNGERGVEVPVVVKDGKATLQLTAAAKTLFYEISGRK